MKLIKMAGFGMALFFCLVLMDCSLGHGTIKFEQSRVQPGVPGNAEAHYLLGGHYQERGRQREAIAEFSKAIAIDPRHVKAYNGLGVSYTQLKEYGPAMQAYAAALALDPNLDYVHNNMGYAYMIQGYTDEAIQAFERALALNTTNPRIHNNLGLAYLAKGYPEKAFAQLSLDKGEAWALCRMGDWYYQYDRFAEAMQQYASALDKAPALVEARKGLEACETQVRMAQALAEAPEPELAEKTIAIESEPYNSQAGISPEAPAIAISAQTQAQAKPSQESFGVEYHVIKRGEYLLKIIRAMYGIFDRQVYHQYLPVVLELNPEIRNPDLVYPGQRICMPKPGSPLLTKRQAGPQDGRLATGLNKPDAQPGAAQG